MKYNTEYELKVHEKACMDSVYKAFQKKINDCNADVECSIRNMDFGDDHSKFKESSEFYNSVSSRSATKALVKGLYRNPYYAHLEITDDESDLIDHYYLSDNETLDEPVKIGHDGYLLPFKLDDRHPAYAAIYRSYTERNGETTYYSVNGVQEAVVPKLICDDEIENAKLLNVSALYPVISQSSYDSDEMLAEKLEENRKNPAFRNIISTLQKQQFEIISEKLDKNFVVQGCAGSGKSQCLMHRLFYLRGKLSHNSWNQVLLLTPTKLFRNYSADAVRRFQLSNINNCSIAELYRQLLDVYDSRFKNRQYKFELTEEYLPDKYLHEVYSQETIDNINLEIENAVSKYTRAGCKAIGESLPEYVDAEFIGGLLTKLDEEIGKFDIREEFLLKDPEYIDKRNRYDEIQRELQKTQKSYDRLTEDLEKNIQMLNELNHLQNSLNDSIKERNLWIKQRNERIAGAKSELCYAAAKLDVSGKAENVGEYSEKLYEYLDISAGKTKLAEDEYLEFLNEYCREIEKDISELTKGQKYESAIKKQTKKISETEEKQRNTLNKITELNNDYVDYANWLRRKAGEYEGEKSRITLKRSELENAKYYLSRIESAVFEQEVWKALAPIKEKYGIETIFTEEIDGHRKESKILYKSDLLFYLEIYYRLHPEIELPEYKLICIDEGQDLNETDYSMLRDLFPEAVFNIFGDTGQVLHEACGIHDWRRETEIDCVHKLTTNYRNTPALVEFCREKFGSTMKSVGTFYEDQRPRVFKSTDELQKILTVNDVVYIVSDRENYIRLCSILGLNQSRVEYLDTNAEKETKGKISCYSIFAAKGLEFKRVLVYANGMSTNQKATACTRAMEKLYYYE